MRAPGIYAETPLTTNSFHVFLVEDFESEPESNFEFVLPLEEHRRRAADDDFLRLFTQKEFSGDKSRFNRLAQTDIVRNEEVDPWKPQRLSERLKPGRRRALSRARRGLKTIEGRSKLRNLHFRVFRYSGKELGRIKTAFGDQVPRFARHHLGINLPFP